MKLEHSRQFFDKYPNTKFYENPPSILHADEQWQRQNEATKSLFVILRTRP